MNPVSWPIPNLGIRILVFMKLNKNCRNYCLIFGESELPNRVLRIRIPVSRFVSIVGIRPREGGCNLSLRFLSVLCGTNSFGKRFFPRIPLPLSTFCYIYSWGKRSEQLTLLRKDSCAYLIKNRGVLCCWCDLFKNDAILVWEPLTKEIRATEYTYRVFQGSWA